MSKLTHRQQASRRRAGFTLIELLVVIGIIAVLASLVASGIFQYVASQKQATTETAIRTLYKVLNTHWDAVVTEAKKEAPSPAVVALAGGDMRRAQVMWVKFRLVEAFPMSFGEIWGAAPIPATLKAAGVAQPPPPPVYANSPLTGTPYIPPPMQKNLATYNKALYAFWTDVVAKNPARKTPPIAGQAESSICLLLALQQSRSGTSLHLDSIAYALAEYADKDASDGYKLKCVVDGWNTDLVNNNNLPNNPLTRISNNNPLAFFRFPCGNPELDASNPSAASAAANKFRDPLDPEGTLQQPSWNNSGNFFGGAKSVYVFEQLIASKVHVIAKAGMFVEPGPLGPPLAAIPRVYPPKGVPIPPPLPAPVQGGYFPQSFYTVPVIVSAGPNGVFNLDAYMGTYDSVTPVTKEMGFDNIYSFRLRLGARGD